MSRLRILHLAKFYSPVKGGMETVLASLCSSERRAVETRALVMNRSRGTRHDIVEGVTVTRVSRWLTVGAVTVAPALPLWLARAEADLLVLHEPNPMALLAYFIVRPAVPLIVWYHADVVRPAWRYRLFYRPLLRFALRRAAQIVVASPPMTHAPALAACRHKCLVIPYGLDGDRYRPTAEVSARAGALRERAGRPILLFVGRLVPYKGLPVLLEAMRGLRAQLVILGDGPLRPTLKTMALELDIEDRVLFAGEATDEERLAWLHACAALVLPSTTRQEAFGIVQLEAMLCARPVVSTALATGVPWVNVHGETGLVVQPGDTAALRDAVARLIASPALRRALGAAARARALAVFNADRMSALTVALYQQASRAAGAAHTCRLATLPGKFHDA
jgi:rhamnosyl/mannosyltransferase